METQKPSRRRRQHSEEFKQAVIAACCEPDVSVAEIAIANGLDSNQVRRWMRDRGIELPSRRAMLAEPEAAPAFVQLPMAPIPAAEPSLGDIRIEVRRGDTAIKVEWPLQASGDCANWLHGWLR